MMQLAGRVEFTGQTGEILKKNDCNANLRPYTLGCYSCGRSSVVERHVANVNVVSSNLIARFKDYSQGWGAVAAKASANHIVSVRYRLSVVWRWSPICLRLISMSRSLRRLQAKGSFFPDAFFVYY